MQKVKKSVRMRKMNGWKMMKDGRILKGERREGRGEGGG